MSPSVEGNKVPSTTFQNLNSEKKDHINKALLHEFSTHSLASAQVARIVKEAGIARGAFYKYFDDLKDAYKYLNDVAVEEIHTPILRTKDLLPAQNYVHQIESFVDEVNGSKYRDFMRLHFQTNEGLLRDDMHLEIQPRSSKEWAIMVLSHETIKDCLLQPTRKDKAIERLSKALAALLQ